MMKMDKSEQLKEVVTPAVTSGCEHLEEEDNEGHRCHSKKSHQEEKIKWWLHPAFEDRR